MLVNVGDIYQLQFDTKPFTKESDSIEFKCDFGNVIIS